MPGYRALSSAFIGSAADSAREAEALRRVGDAATAVALLEEALDASCRVSSELPGWLCGRLAALYRTLGRYDDEVALLERYRESQRSEEARSRYDARLSKARTIAERRRRTESGALKSVRKVLATPRRRAASAANASSGTSVSSAPAAPATPDTSAFRRDCVVLLASQVHEPDAALEQRLAMVLVAHCAAARAANLPVEHLVHALKAAARDDALRHLPAEERGARYSAMLVHLLAAFFEETGS